MRKTLSTVATLLVLAGCARAQGPHRLYECHQIKKDGLASPDRELVALVFTSKDNESRIEICSKAGASLRAIDFLSDDHSHGYGVDGAQWTANAQFFVFRLRSSGGHSPVNVPVVFWKRKGNRFYHLDGYTGDTTFALSPPDKVSVDTFPAMKAATLSLHLLQPHEVSEMGRHEAESIR